MMPTPEGCEDRRTGRVDAGALDDRRGVVDDGVDPGYLLQDRQADADQQRRLHGRGLEVAPPARIGSGAPGDLVDLVVDRLFAGRADPQQGGFGSRGVALHHQPARTARQTGDADRQYQGRYCAEAEHPAPALVDIREGESHQVGDQDPDRHRKLEEGHQTAAHVGRGDLADVDRRDRGGDTDTDTDDHPRRDQDESVGREGGDDCPDDEDRGRDQDKAAAPVPVGAETGKPGAGDRSDGYRSDHHARLEADRDRTPA